MAHLEFRVTRFDGEHHESYDFIDLKEFNKKRLELEARGKPKTQTKPKTKKK